jgi:hypothetical protein
MLGRARGEGDVGATLVSMSSARVYEMTAHLLLAQTPFSRNRNYDAFDDPRFQSALALYRRLRSITSDLERALHDGSALAVREETHAGRPSVRLEIRGSRTRRTSWLEKPAWDVLMLHPGARAAVEKLAKVAA